MRNTALLLFLLLVPFIAATSVHPKEQNDNTTGRNQTTPPHKHVGIHVANWRWDEIGVFFTFTAFIVVTGLAKVAFHHAHWLSSRIPESCLMIIMGIAVGGVLYLCGVQSGDPQQVQNIPTPSPPLNHENLEEPPPAFALPTFTPRLFFLVLLPPVILESAYSLYDRAFADNLSTILLYAVVGTLFNTFAIGALLYLVATIGIMGSMSVYGAGNYSLTWLDAFVFSSLISAVDPVAVLAIFQEVGVNKDLYFLVFGESLLNDAVTVVLYTTMVTFTEMPVIQGEQYALAVIAFFTVSCGGLAVGIVFGLLTALITRTTEDCRVVEPLAVLGMAYLSYLTAELFHFSGIISIIGCGLVQAHYALKNISHKSYTTVKYFTKMLSSTSDAIIFLFLGMVLVSDTHVWHTGFVLWTLVLCLICRFAGVFILTALSNLVSVRQIELQEQFIMAYGGLRGAVGFSLVQMLDADFVPPRQLFVTTTLVVILFTVFLQGGTIKTLVELLHIERSRKEHKKLQEEVSDHIISMLMAGIEEIAGARGDYYIRRKLEYIDDKYFKRVFLTPDAEGDLQRLFEKLTLTEHFAHLYGPVTLVEDRKMLGYGSEDSLEAVMRRAQPGSYMRVTDMFPGVELRRRGTLLPVRPTTSPQPPLRGRSLTEGEILDSMQLRKAFRNTPYQRFHYRHNRNLIDDDYQELREHLQRRLVTARHITHMAALGSRHHSAQSAIGSQSVEPEFFSQSRRQVHSELEGVYPEELRGMNAIFNRANRRISIAQQRSSSAGERYGGSSEDESSIFPGSVQAQPGSTQQLRNITETDEFLHPHAPSRSRSDRGSSESVV